MRVIAARFEKRETAQSVLRSLRARYDLGPDDASVAPLPDRDGTVLAGRFRDDRCDAVRALIAGAGGQVLTEVDEALTRPRHRVGGAAVVVAFASAGVVLRAIELLAAR